MSKDIKRILELNQSIQQMLDDMKIDLTKGLSPWLDKDQAAAYIGMSKSNLDRYMDKIPHSRATGRPKFHRKDLDAFMNSKKLEVYP